MTDRARQILETLAKTAPNLIDTNGELRSVPLHDRTGRPPAVIPAIRAGGFQHKE